MAKIASFMVVSLDLSCEYGFVKNVPCEGEVVCPNDVRIFRRRIQHHSREAVLAVVESNESQS